MNKQLKTVTGSYKEVDGDAIKLLTEAKDEKPVVFMHGANCQRIMGSGIAGQVRKQLPALYFVDQFDKRSAGQKFGSFSAVTFTPQNQPMRVGVNLYTQYNPGPEFDLTALKSALRGFKLDIPLQYRGEYTLIVPKIGAGIGGGNWEEIVEVLKTELKDFNLVVVNYLKIEEMPEPSKKE